MLWTGLVFCFLFFFNLSCFRISGHIVDIQGIYFYEWRKNIERGTLHSLSGTLDRESLRPLNCEILGRVHCPVEKQIQWWSCNITVSVLQIFRTLDSRLLSIPSCNSLLRLFYFLFQSPISYLDVLELRNHSFYWKMYNISKNYNTKSSLTSMCHIVIAKNTWRQKTLNFRIIANNDKFGIFWILQNLFVSNKIYLNLISLYSPTSTLICSGLCFTLTVSIFQLVVKSI